VEIAEVHIEVPEEQWLLVWKTIKGHNHVWQVSQGGRGEIGANNGSTLFARDQHATEDVGAVAVDGFEVPVGGRVAVGKSNAAFVVGSCVGGID
jgi:hypothetical protein